MSIRGVRLRKFGGGGSIIKKKTTNKGGGRREADNLLLREEWEKQNGLTASIPPWRISTKSKKTSLEDKSSFCSKEAMRGFNAPNKVGFKAKSCFKRRNSSFVMLKTPKIGVEG